MSEIKNRMVLLAEQLRELTHGICKMGPGPYGIGVSTDAASPLTAILLLTPNPFEEGDVRLPDDQNCTAEMRAYTKEQWALRTYLTRDELTAFSQGDDPAARIVAEAILRMNESIAIIRIPGKSSGVQRAHGRVVVLGGRQPACVLRLALHALSSPPFLS